MMQRKWTEEEIEILEKYYPLVPMKCSIEELAEIMNRSPNSVRSKAQGLGLRTQQVDMIDRDLLKTLVERVKI